MLKTLQKGLSPSTLLSYIDSNKDHIKRQHVVAALSSLHHFYEDKSQSATNLDEQIDFTKLYTCLKPQIQQLTVTEIIEALGMLQLLNVPSSNIFAITLFQQVEEFVKELSFQNIYKLSILLEKFDSTNLTESIDSAIKNQFLSRISQINKNDSISLIYALCFSSRHVQDKIIINSLIKSIEHYNTQIELKDAINILELLCSIKEFPYKFTNIINQVQQVIINNIDELKPNQILQIIQGLSSNIILK